MKKSKYIGLVILFLVGCTSLEKVEKQPEQKIAEEEVKSVEQELVSSKDILLIEDFDAGIRTNYLGGNWGAWDKDPKDKTQFCKEEFDEKNRYGKEGYCLKITYDVDSPNPAYNGFWMKLEKADFSPYSKICFYAKIDEQVGGTDRFKVELKNTKGEVGKTMVSGLTKDWQLITIPFNKFRGISEFNEMTEFVIVFEDTVANPKSGIIYIDNIFVSK